MKRIILEMGTGNDLYGMDYTKAARRAIQDALHHSSIVLFKSLGYDHAQMQVRVTIGVQEPDTVSPEDLRTCFPIGTPEIRVQKGGLNVSNPDTGTTIVIASAAVEVFLPSKASEFRLSTA